MCGRFAVDFNHQELSAQLELQGLSTDGPIPPFSPSFNVAPTHSSPVYTKNQVRLMSWGLVPFWMNDFNKSQQYKTFNARKEAVGTSRMWRSPCKHGRCVVPVSGYYEWKPGRKGVKVPYLVTAKHAKIIFLAGMFDVLEQNQRPAIFTFTIITQPAPSKMQWLHDRMPVVLDPNSSAWDLWMDETKESWGNYELEKVLQTACIESLDCYPVPSEVGKPSNNYKELMQPIANGILVSLRNAKMLKAEDSTSLTDVFNHQDHIKYEDKHSLQGQQVPGAKKRKLNSAASRSSKSVVDLLKAVSKTK